VPFRCVVAVNEIISIELGITRSLKKKDCVKY
jgi:hypothetical protein